MSSFLFVITVYSSLTFATLHSTYIDDIFYDTVVLNVSRNDAQEEIIVRDFNATDDASFDDVLYIGGVPNDRSIK